MKSMTTKILALTAALFGLQLSAANPVAVWDGDFKTTTKGGWTLSSTGSTITDAKITIGSTPITMTPSTTQNCGWYTIIYKVKGLKNTSQTPLATWGRPEVAGYNNPDLVGAFLDTDYPWGVWDGAERTKYSLQKKINLSSAGAEEHRVVVRFHSGVNYGVWAYVDGTKVFTADNDLKSSIDINRMTILGFQYNSGNVLTGAEVTSLAIFCDASDAGDAAFTSYKFPSDPQAISVNFNASTSARTVTGDPGAVYSDSNWHNLTGKSGTDVVIDNVKISYSASGVYNNDDMDKSYNKGYLDDNNSTHTTVAVSNLKNGYYNLVIYCSSDNATRFSYKTVNGKDYTYDSTTGAAKEGTASWGSNATSSAEPGNHALLIKNLQVTNGTIAIDSLRRDESSTVKIRGSISAIQIAEVPYEATVTGDMNWANLNWTPTTPPSGADVKLINNGGTGVTTITLADNVSVGKLTVESAAGKELKMNKNDYTATIGSYALSNAGTLMLWKIADTLDVSTAPLSGSTAATFGFDLGANNVMSVSGTTADTNRRYGLMVTSGTLDFNTDYSSTGVTPFAGRTVTADGADAVIKLSKSDSTGWSSAGTAIVIKNGATMSIVKRDTLMTPVTLAGGTVTLEAGCGSSERGLDLFGNMSGSSKTVNAWNVSGNSAITVATSASNEAGDNTILLRDQNWEITVAESGTFTVGATLVTTLPTQQASGTRGKLVKKGAGKIVLTSASTYDTGTEVLEGTLKVTASSALGTGAVSVSSGAKIELEAPENVACTVGNAISGEGRIEKLGAGSFTLLGNNTYSGGTTISEGVLVLDSDSALGSGTVTLTANGQLDLYGHSVTVTIVGSGTICNSSSTTAHINGIPVGAGKELTFTEGKTSIIVPEGETLTLTALPPNDMVTIGGAGKVAYTTTAEAPAYPTWTWIADGDDAWTGTYALSGFTTATTQTCGENGWDLRPYYNGTNSVFEIVGSSASATVEGYFNNVSISVGELVLNGAIKIVNGYSNYTYSFTKISGSKAFTVNTSNTITATVKFADISAFTGTLSVSSPKNSDKKCYCVIVGEGTLSEGDASDMSSIYFTGDTTLNMVTFSASNGVKVNGDAVVTVLASKFPQCSSGTMTFENGSSIVLEDANAKLIANGGISVAEGKTIPVTIEDTKGLTAGTALITWTSQPSGNFLLEAGSGAAKGTSGFKASKNSGSLTAVADTSKTYYEVEGGETTTFDNQWLTDAKISGSTEQVQTALNDTNTNGIKMSDVYLMGYEAKDAQNAAVILKPDQAQSNGETISLSVAGVPTTTRNGAVITYTALASADRNWESPSVEEEMGATGSVSMALPTSGVLYYRVQATVALP